MSRLVTILVLSLAGCGRIGFDPVPAPARDGGGIDASAPDGGAGVDSGEVPVPAGEVVPVKLSAGYYHTCALYSNGGVKCWGNNDFGQLGYGNLTSLGDDASEVGDGALQFLDFGTAEPAVDVGAGHWHSCALFESGAVKCWGQNQAGATGNERNGLTVGDQPGELASSSADYLQPIGVRPIQMSVIKRNVCIVYDDDSLRCSGQNDYGQLGTESFESLGDGPGEMGDNLLPIDLGTGLVATAVIEGDYHTCALLRGGRIKCWGRGDYGRLGYGNTAHRGGNPGDMGDGLPFVDLGAGRTAVALYRGYFGGCARLDDGSFKCWGANVGGELGIGSTNNAGDAAGEMGDALPSFAPGLDVASIHGGYHLWCVISPTRELRCMGLNAGGVLGRGNADNWGDGPGETWAVTEPIDLGTGRRLRGTSPNNVAIGLAHMCALLDDFRIRCWGTNESGELFVGDTANRGDGAGEMGDALPSFRP